MLAPARRPLPDGGRRGRAHPRRRRRCSAPSIGRRVDLGRSTGAPSSASSRTRPTSRDEFALVAPGHDSRRRVATPCWSTRAGAPAGRPPVDGSGKPRSRSRRAAAGPRGRRGHACWSPSTLAMALVGLIAAAGFVVVAQRRQRQLGLLAAIGATERHLRLVMLANGAIVGVRRRRSSAPPLGVVGWIARRARGRVGRRPPHRPVRPAVGADRRRAWCSPSSMATAAAWWPARDGVAAAGDGGAVGPAGAAPAGAPLAARRRACSWPVGVAGHRLRPPDERARPAAAAHRRRARRGDRRRLRRAGGDPAGGLAGPAAAVRAPARAARPRPLPGPRRRRAGRDHARARASPSPSSASPRPTRPAPRRGQPVRPRAARPRRRPAHVGSNPATTAGGAWRRSTSGRRPSSPRSATGYRAVPLDVAFVAAAASGRPRTASRWGSAIDAHTIRVPRLPLRRDPRGARPLRHRPGVDRRGHRPPDRLGQTDRCSSVAGNEPPARGRRAASAQHVDLPGYSVGPDLADHAGGRAAPRLVDGAGGVDRRVAARRSAPSQIAAARAAAAEAGLPIEVAHQPRTWPLSLRTRRHARRRPAGPGHRGHGGRADPRRVGARPAHAHGHGRGAADPAGADRHAPPARWRARGRARHRRCLRRAGRRLQADLDQLVPLPVDNLLWLLLGLPLAASLAGWLLAGREPRVVSRQALS